MNKLKKKKKKIFIIFGLILFAIFYIFSSNLNIEKTIEENIINKLFEENKIKIPSYLNNNIDFWEKIFFEKDAYSVIYYTPNQNVNIKQIDIIPEISLKNKGIINIILKSQDKEISRFTLFDLIDSSSPDQLFSQDEIRTKINEVYDDLNNLLRNNGTLKNHENIGYTRGKKEKSENAIRESGKFMNQIKTIFEKENVPGDIANLVFIESFFDYNAISSNNARGIFQMIPQTAKNYGLIVNKNIDERKDPLIQAHATAKYLNYLYKIFDNWIWAINAYHSGEYNLKRALIWANKYYPEKPNDFDGDLREYQYMKVINEFPQDKEFNNIKNTIYGTHSARYTTLFFAFLKGKENIEDSIKKEKSIYFDTIEINYKNDYKKEKNILIKSGDTLIDLAHEYSVNIDDLKKWNNLENSMIFSGKTLKIWIEEPPIKFQDISEKLNLSPKEIDFLFDYNFSYKKDNQSKSDFLEQKLYSKSKINLPLGKGEFFKKLIENY
jgi:hypothetical protein